MAYLHYYKCRALQQLTLMPHTSTSQEKSGNYDNKPPCPTYKHVKGHQDTGTHAALSWLALMNVEMDLKAKQAIREDFSRTNEYQMPGEGGIAIHKTPGSPNNYYHNCAIMSWNCYPRTLGKQ